MKRKDTKKAAPAGKKQKAAQSSPSSLKKLYLKTKSLCKVTFRLPKKAAPDATQVTLVGDFNQWDTHETPMKKMKNGDFTVTLELAPDQQYKFKYLIDDHIWENDWQADAYVPNCYGSDDSLVDV